MNYNWPDELWFVGQLALNQRGMVLVGPKSITGKDQLSSTDAGYWTASISMALLFYPAEINAWRALRARLEGGVNLVRLPLWDKQQAPWPSSDEEEAPALKFTDGKQFSDGTGFYNPTIRVYLAADAALRDTVISVTKDNAGTILPGMLLTIADHLYVVRDTITQTQWRIWPPLRGAIAAGRKCEMQNPTSLMRLIDDQEMDLTIKGGLWQAQPTANFVEA